MVSLISLHRNSLPFSSSSSCSTSSSSINKARLSILPRRQQEKQQKHSVDLVVFKKTSSLGVSCLFQRGSGLGFVRKRRKSKAWEGEGDPDLEAEVLEFMKISRNPNSFPSKEELIVNGRLDLVKRIVKQGGWLASGWGLDDVEEQEWEQEQERGHQNSVRDESNDSRIFQNRFDGGETSTESSSLKGFEAGSNGVSSSTPDHYTSPPSFSGRTEGKDDAGIDGILSRLGKQRTWSPGRVSNNKESKARGTLDNAEEYYKRGVSEEDSSESGSSVPQSSSEDSVDDSGGLHIQSDSFPGGDESSKPLKPDMWRKWSNKRAGVSEFEAAEFGENMIRNDKMVRKDTNETGSLRTELSSGNKEKDFSQQRCRQELSSGNKKKGLSKQKSRQELSSEEEDFNQLRSRLKDMDLELSSVLRTVISQTDMVASAKKVKDSSETESLSDTWEFRETEVMRAKDKLRSLRAQLAVLEGKMALKIIEAQKMVEVKEKKIHTTRNALKDLRTVCVVWTKPASEVFLVGSFDGWTSQRVMEKTSSGIFSLYLMLYPGLYEVKFIVDGEWKTDPLRPSIETNGHLNNLIVIN